MSARTLKQNGFTLVEILIVVVILGILAAIVIPQFTSASESARASSLKTQLQTIRSQLELYQVQHLGAYPTHAQLTTTNVDGDTKDDWDNLTQITNNAGTIGSGAGFELGSYLQKPPSNPFTASGNGTEITPMTGGVAAAAAVTFGWAYDPATGQVKAVLDDVKAKALELVPAAYSESGQNPDFVTY